MKTTKLFFLFTILMMCIGGGKIQAAPEIRGFDDWDNDRVTGWNEIETDHWRGTLSATIANSSNKEFKVYEYYDNTEHWYGKDSSFELNFGRSDTETVTEEGTNMSLNPYSDSSVDYTVDVVKNGEHNYTVTITRNDHFLQIRGLTTNSDGWSSDQANLTYSSSTEHWTGYITKSQLTNSNKFKIYDGTYHGTAANAFNLRFRTSHNFTSILIDGADNNDISLIVPGLDPDDTEYAVDIFWESTGYNVTISRSTRNLYITGIGEWGGNSGHCEWDSSTNHWTGYITNNGGSSQDFKLFDGASTIGGANTTGFIGNGQNYNISIDIEATTPGNNYFHYDDSDAGKPGTNPKVTWPTTDAQGTIYYFDIYLVEGEGYDVTVSRSPIPDAVYIGGSLTADPSTTVVTADNQTWSDIKAANHTLTHKGFGEFYIDFDATEFYNSDRKGRLGYGIGMDFRFIDRVTVKGVTTESMVYGNALRLTTEYQELIAGGTPNDNQYIGVAEEDFPDAMKYRVWFKYFKGKRYAKVEVVTPQIYIGGDRIGGWGVVNEDWKLTPVGGGEYYIDVTAAQLNYANRNPNNDNAYIGMEFRFVETITDFDSNTPSQTLHLFPDANGGGLKLTSTYQPSISGSDYQEIGDNRFGVAAIEDATNYRIYVRRNDNGGTVTHEVKVVVTAPDQTVAYISGSMPADPENNTVADGQTWDQRRPTLRMTYDSTEDAYYMDFSATAYGNSNRKELLDQGTAMDFRFVKRVITNGDATDYKVFGSTTPQPLSDTPVTVTQQALASSGDNYLTVERVQDATNYRVWFKDDNGTLTSWVEVTVFSPAGGLFINSATITVAHGEAPFTYAVRATNNQEDTPIISGTSATNTFKISTPGYLTVTDATGDVISGSNPFNFTYSTSENYVNFWHNKTGGVAYNAEMTDENCPNGKDYNRMRPDDKTYLLDPTWGNASLVSVEETSIAHWSGYPEATNTTTGYRKHVSSTLSQTISGLNTGKEYTVQALVRAEGASGVKVKLTLNGETEVYDEQLARYASGNTDSSNPLRGSFVTKTGRVEYLTPEVYADMNKQTSMGWFKLQAKAYPDASGNLQISIARSAGQLDWFDLADVVLLEDADRPDGTTYRTTATKINETVTYGTGKLEMDTYADYRDWASTASSQKNNAFSFFDRGENRNAVVFANEHTVLCLDGHEHPYNVVKTTSATDQAGVCPVLYLTDMGVGDVLQSTASAEYKGSGYTFKSVIPFNATNVVYDRSYALTKSTIILPFTLTQAQIKAAYSNNVKVYKFQEYHADSKDVVFSKLGDEEDLAANQPYILFNATGTLDSRSATQAAAKPSTMRIPEVNALDNLYHATEETSVAGAFTGRFDYARMSTYNAGKTEAYYGYNNNQFLIVNSAGANMKPFRAYFTVPYSGESTLAPALSISFLDEPQVTGITDVEDHSQKDGYIYSVNGMLIRRDSRTDSLPKGIYILNGRKFVVK